MSSTHASDYQHIDTANHQYIITPTPQHKHQHHHQHHINTTINTTSHQYSNISM
jgi:hypothetical protein